MAPFRRICGLILLSSILASCDLKPKSVEPTPLPTPTSEPSAQQSEFSLKSLTFADLPLWRTQSVEPAFQAFHKTCTGFLKKDPETVLSKTAGYAGKIKDWLPACEILPKYHEAGEYHRFFEDYFQPFEIETTQVINKLTGYYEPELSVSEKKTAKYSTPIPLRPKDLIEARLGVFDPALEGKTVWGQIQNGRLVLYPERADIRIEPDRVLAYADPADVFFLQIQGSGRLRFTNGKVSRAGFDAHNHRPFGSLANHLIKTGELKTSEASMQGIRRWIEKVGPERAAQAMNVNPRFVFFRERVVENDNEGPIGAAGLPLTPLGSLAVDLDLHALGVPFYLSSKFPTKTSGWKGEDTGSLLVAQDTGGAIKGARRGDIFFGWGDSAGAVAGRMNHQGRFFVLLPQGMTVEPAT